MQKICTVNDCVGLLLKFVWNAGSPQQVFVVKAGRCASVDLGAQLPSMVKVSKVECGDSPRGIFGASDISATTVAVSKLSHILHIVRSSDCSCLEKPKLGSVTPEIR